MSTVLFAFLGTGNYRPAIYAFGRKPHERATTRFVAQAMLEVAKAGGNLAAPDRIILCGTATSGWHALVEVLQNPKQVTEKSAGTKITPVDAAELAGFSTVYSNLLGVPVTCQLISFGTDAMQQAGFVSMVNSHVGDGDTVHFDVTHGLRHLSMLALMAALAVRTLRNATIAGVWYGAFELANTPEGEAITGMKEATPMIKLDGLLAISDWLAAINVFDATGNVGAFAAPLRKENKTETANRLEDAAFSERTQVTQSARNSAQYALIQLDDVTTGVADVVRPAIEARLGWANEVARHDAGFDHALRFAETGNEARAATLIYETTLALISQASQIDLGQKGMTDALAKACRETKKHGAQSAIMYASTYLEMKELRNALVHSGAIDIRDKQLANKTEFNLNSPQACRSALKRMAQVLRQTPPEALIAELRDQIKSGTYHK